MFQTTRPIKSLAGGGVNLDARQPVTPQAFTPELWARLVAEGVVVEVGERPLPATAPDLDTMAVDALKALADEMGVTYTWNIKAETLRERIKAHDQNL